MINAKRKKQISICAFVAISSLLMALNANSFPFNASVTGTDSSVFIYIAKMILGGETPYLDTFDHKGPVLYLINVLGLLISSRVGIWLLEYITILITFIFAYKIARLLGCREISSCIVVAIGALVLNYYFEGGNLVEEYACVFLTISLYLFLQFFITSKTSAWKLMLCGASFAAVLLLRVNMVVLWAVMCIGVLVYCIKNGLAKKIMGFIIWFLLGAAFVLVPIVIWFWYNKALTHFVDNYLLFNLKYASDSNTASIRSIMVAIVAFCTGSPVLIAAPILVYLCSFKKNIADWLCFISLGLSILSMCIAGRTYGHYGMILYPLVVYALSRACSELGETLFLSSIVSKRKKVSCALSLLCVVILLFLHPIASMAENILSIPMGMNYKTTYHEIAEVVRNNTEEDALITVCGNQNIIYLLSDRKSASKYSYQSPIAEISPNIKAEYLEDIRQLKAEMIVVSNNYILFDDIMEVVEQEYSLIDTIDTTQIYLKNQ